jgi:hypothetical protein
MDFHSPRGCAQLRGDLFLLKAPDQARGNLTLPSRQAVHALDEDIIKPLLRFCTSTLFEPWCHRRNEWPDIDRLGQRIDCAALHPLNGRGHIAASGHENY